MKRYSAKITKVTTAVVVSSATVYVDAEHDVDAFNKIKRVGEYGDVAWEDISESIQHKDISVGKIKEVK